MPLVFKKVNKDAAPDNKQSEPTREKDPLDDAVANALALDKEPEPVVEEVNTSAEPESVSETKKPKFSLGKRTAATKGKTFNLNKPASAPDNSSVAPVTKEPTPDKTTPAKTDKVQVAEYLDDLANHEHQPLKYTEKDVEQLDKNFNMLAQHIEDKELVQVALSELMVTINENPEFADLLEPEDMGLMLRGLRKSYGIKIVKKKERSRTSSQNARIDDALGKALKEMGVNLT